ncbi:MAG: hypothetical protein MHPSP_001125, partial [Paramarteilia canceri]
DNEKILHKFLTSNYKTKVVNADTIYIPKSKFTRFSFFGHKSSKKKTSISLNQLAPKRRDSMMLSLSKSQNLLQTKLSENLEKSLSIPDLVEEVSFKQPDLKSDIETINTKIDTFETYGVSEDIFKTLDVKFDMVNVKPFLERLAQKFGINPEDLEILENKTKDDDEEILSESSPNRSADNWYDTALNANILHNMRKSILDEPLITKEELNNIFTIMKLDFETLTPMIKTNPSIIELADPIQ